MLDIVQRGRTDARFLNISSPLLARERFRASDKRASMGARGGSREVGDERQLV